MVKSKQPNFVPANTNRKKSSGEDDDWVIVKKQRVNIIIPPSPRQLALPNPLDPGPEIEVNPRVDFPSEKERSDSSIPETIRVDDDFRMCPQPMPAGLNKSVPEEGLVVCNSSRKIKRLPVSANRNAILHRRIRTMLIEKKLNQVGGLSKWLVSLGLDRFMKIFECNGVDKYQLACLTMGELKDLGAYPVEGVNFRISELAEVAAQQRAVREECEALLASTVALQVEEDSLRTNLIQLRQNLQLN